MSKQAISLTLDRDNILWIKGQVKARGARSVSEAMDDILSAARRSRGQVTSVVGTVRILDDTELLSADDEVRRAFEASLSRGERRVAAGKKSRA